MDRNPRAGGAPAPERAHAGAWMYLTPCRPGSRRAVDTLSRGPRRATHTWEQACGGEAPQSSCPGRGTPWRTAMRYRVRRVTPSHSAARLRFPLARSRAKRRWRRSISRRRNILQWNTTQAERQWKITKRTGIQRFKCEVFADDNGPVGSELLGTLLDERGQLGHRHRCDPRDHVPVHHDHPAFLL